jgi:hypothetical protein
MASIYHITDEQAKRFQAEFCKEHVPREQITEFLKEFPVSRIKQSV